MQKPYLVKDYCPKYMENSSKSDEQTNNQTKPQRGSEQSLSGKDAPYAGTWTATPSACPAEMQMTVTRRPHCRATRQPKPRKQTFLGEDTDTRPQRLTFFWRL